MRYDQGTLTLHNGHGSVIDTLHFAGTYTAGDFALQAKGGSTEILYAGPTGMAPHTKPPEFWRDHGSAAGAVPKPAHEDSVPAWHPGAWIG